MASALRDARRMADQRRAAVIAGRDGGQHAGIAQVHDRGRLRITVAGRRGIRPAAQAHVHGGDRHPAGQVQVCKYVIERRHLIGCEAEHAGWCAWIAARVSEAREHLDGENAAVLGYPIGWFARAQAGVQAGGDAAHMGAVKAHIGAAVEALAGRLRGARTGLAALAVRAQADLAAAATGIGEAGLGDHLAAEKLMVGLDPGIEHRDGITLAGSTERVGIRHPDQRHALQQDRRHRAIVVDHAHERVGGERLEFRAADIDGEAGRKVEAMDSAGKTPTRRRTRRAAEVSRNDGILDRRDPRPHRGDAGGIGTDLARRHRRLEPHDDADIALVLRDRLHLGGFRRLLRQGRGHLRHGRRCERKKDDGRKRASCRSPRRAQYRPKNEIDHCPFPGAGCTSSAGGPRSGP